MCVHEYTYVYMYIGPLVAWQWGGCPGATRPRGTASTELPRGTGDEGPEVDTSCIHTYHHPTSIGSKQLSFVRIHLQQAIYKILYCMTTCQNYMQHIMKLSKSPKKPKHPNTCRSQPMEYKRKQNPTNCNAIDDFTYSLVRVNTQKKQTPSTQVKWG